MTDVVTLIEIDHREFERIFDALAADVARRPELMGELSTLLTAHSRAEEAEVYPVAARVGEADEVHHGVEEHREAEELLAHLITLDPASDGFGATLEDLSASVRHHIDEEERTLLKDLRERTSDERLEELGVAFLAARAARMDQRPEASAGEG